MSSTESLVQELKIAWARSDALFEMLAPEALHDRPIALRHPFVFYLGHLPAFAWNQVARGVLGEEGFRPEFDALFERGIDPEDESTAPTIEDWPDPIEILAYRDRVREEILRRIPDLQAKAAEDVLAENLRILHLVLEHELMHHETLLYMLAELRPERKRMPGDAPPLVLGGPPAPGAVRIPAGPIRLGARFEDLPFGWDTEFPDEIVEVESFALDRHPVTVAAYRGFVEAEDRPPPHRWFQDADGHWHHRTMGGSVPLDEIGGWPVQVTAEEAEAFCRWSDARLPTEAELHRAAHTTPEGGERPFPWGDAPPGPERGNFGDRRYDPVPVGRHPAGASAFGVEDLLGNGWEWTSTPFLTRPGFSAYIRTYPGYSADFFDGEHRVIFGGSWSTATRLLRRSFRNWFRPDYPYVFATFRRAW